MEIVALLGLAAVATVWIGVVARRTLRDLLDHARSVDDLDDRQLRELRRRHGPEETYRG